tara:strand:- start:879 stop:1850 length:972 start_codon:yes stop_codon:yes gene_type:complete
MPTRGNTHIDGLINNLMTARMFRPQDAICPEVFPTVLVDRPSDKFPILNTAFLRKDDDRLGPKGKANDVQWDFDTAGSYYIDDFGYTTSIEGRTLREADTAIRRKYRLVSSRVVTDKLILQRELRGAASLFSASVFSGKTEALSGSDQLNDPASDIFDIIGGGIENVRTQCGKRANTIIMGGAVWSAVQRHPDMRESRADSKMKSLMDMDEVRQVFSNKRMKMSKVIVGDSQYNTAAENQTASWSDVWGKFLLVAYIDYNAVTELEQSLTKCFQEKGNAGVSVKFYKDSENEDAKSEDCRAEVHYDDNVLDTSCGYLFSTAVA